ncbi:MAG: translation initiation factor eIF2B subunit beta [Amphiamblys sp. WSBS2006]|nr:MAG: translation initiation factor eIF2B subunit beta [Amphiamblys sp. WSBS2006]
MLAMEFTNGLIKTIKGIEGRETPEETTAELEKTLADFRKRFPCSLALHPLITRLLRVVGRMKLQASKSKTMFRSFLVLKRLAKIQSFCVPVQELVSEIEGSLDLFSASSQCMKPRSKILLYANSDLAYSFVESVSKNTLLSVLLVENPERRAAANGGIKTLLAERNIPVTVLPYHCAHYALKTVKTLVLDCEMVTRCGGAVARAGSLSLAAMAARYALNINVLAATYMFSHTQKHSLWNQPLSASAPLFTKTVFNSSRVEPTSAPLFDFIPARLLTRFITSEGIYMPSEIEFLEHEIDTL